jgi:hypothetical protein
LVGNFRHGNAFCDMRSKFVAAVCLVKIS